jgi:hypothetical protein
VFYATRFVRGRLCCRLDCDASPVELRCGHSGLNLGGKMEGNCAKGERDEGGDRWFWGASNGGVVRGVGAATGGREGSARAGD